MASINLAFTLLAGANMDGAWGGRRPLMLISYRWGGHGLGCSTASLALALSLAVAPVLISYGLN